MQEGLGVHRAFSNEIEAPQRGHVWGLATVVMPDQHVGLIAAGAAGIAHPHGNFPVLPCKACAGAEHRVEPPLAEQRLTAEGHIGALNEGAGHRAVTRYIKRDGGLSDGHRRVVRVEQQDAPGDVVHRMFAKGTSKLLHIVVCNVAVVIGEADDRAARPRQRSIAPGAVAARALEQGAGGHVKSLDEGVGDGAGVVGRGVVDDQQFPAHGRALAFKALEASVELPCPVTGADHHADLDDFGPGPMRIEEGRIGLRAHLGSEGIACAGVHGVTPARGRCPHVARNDRAAPACAHAPCPEQRHC